MTVLVVEDNDFVQFVLLALLEEQGCTAVGVLDGRAALAYLQTAPELPSLILLDLMMPTMDGWAFCAALRCDARLATIPIVVMSARHDVADQAARLGVADYLAKPFDADALLAIVERYGRAAPEHTEGADDRSGA